MPVKPLPLEVKVPMTEKSGGGHADSGVATDHRDVHHECHLEAATEGIAADLADGDLREAHQVVVEAE